MESAVLDEMARLERPLLFGARSRASAGAAGASSQLVAVDHPDLESLVARASGGPPRKRKLETGSASRMAYVRKCKGMQVVQRDSQKFQTKAQLAELEAAAAALLSPDATRFLGKKLNRGYRAFPQELVGKVVSNLAFATRKRSDDTASKRQNLAAAHVMRLVQSLQEETVWSSPASAAAADAPSSSTGAADNSSRSGAGAAPDGRASSTVLLLTHQFDASKQRRQEVFAPETDESANSSSKHTGVVTSSVMMQRFQSRRFVSGSRTLRKAPPPEPYILPASFLKEGSGDFYLEGLLRQMPFRIEDKAEVLKVTSSADFVIIMWTIDRDTSNGVVLQWLFDVLEVQEFLNLFPLSLPCLIHGTQLVKERYAPSMQHGAASLSLARQFRLHSFRSSARTALRKHVLETCQVRYCKRPVEVTDMAENIWQQLFPHKERNIHFDTAQAQVRGPTNRLRYEHSSTERRAMAVLNSFDIQRRRDGSRTLVWCYWCCDDASHWSVVSSGTRRKYDQIEKEGTARVAAIAEDYCFTLAWQVAALNRWGYIDVLERKVFLLSVVSNSLASMLEGVRRSENLSLGVEAGLARQIAAHPEDLSSKNKLKLVRLCKVFGSTASNLRLVLTIQRSGFLNELYYCLAGSKDKEAPRPRLTLLEMITPEGSPIAYLQNRILELAQHFAADAASWHILEVLGVDFANVEVRLETRASLLRAHTGLIHHFEKLLGSAPINLLLTLPEVEMEREETEAVISDFLSQPLPCLNLCGRRMRALCKKPSDVYSKLEDPLRALGLGGVLDSAGVERDAAQVRKDLSNAMGGGSQQYCRRYPASILCAGSEGTC